MKRSTWGMILCVTSLAGAMAVTAEARQRVDKNGDGVVSSDEITTAYMNNKPKRQELFRQLDADKSGTLSETEVGNSGNMKMLDLNKDGQVTENEFLAGLAKETSEKAAQADRNKDGQIDQGEKQTVVEKWKEKHGK